MKEFEILISLYRLFDDGSQYASINGFSNSQMVIL
jgi:hypothetical protein